MGRKHRKSLVFAILVALVGQVAWAAPEGAIYRWTDAFGTVHFTDRGWRIPAAHRELASALPPTGGGTLSWIEARGELRIPFEREGHLMKVRVELDQSVEAPFYVDTGATHVALPNSVAKRLGFDPDAPARKLAMRTAAGVIEVPAIELSSIAIGGAEVRDVVGTVNGHLEIGLLGGSFFNHFNYSVDTAAEVIVLRPRERGADDGPAVSSPRRAGDAAREPDRAGGDT